MVRQSLEALITCHDSAAVVPDIPPSSGWSWGQLPLGGCVRQRQIRDHEPQAISCTKLPYRTTSAEQSRASEDAMPDDIHGPELFEIIRITRSMWRLKSDPVPNELTGRTTFRPPL